MKKQTQNKTNNSQKKRRTRLLATWIPVGTVVLAGAVAGVVLGAKSCSKGLNVVYVTQDENLGTFTVEGGLNQDTTITFSPKASYVLDSNSVVVSVNDRNLIKGTEYTINGNSIIIKAKYVTSNNIKVRGKAKVKIVGTPVSIEATGFQSKVQYDKIVESELDVRFKLSDGSTSDPLKYDVDYKLEVSVDAGDYEPISLPYTCTALGSYSFRVINIEDESMDCIESISVIPEREYTVELDTSAIPATITATLQKTEIKRSDSEITITANYYEEGAKVAKTKGRFVAFLKQDETNDVETEVAYSDYFELANSQEETKDITFSITNWSQFFDDDTTVYIKFEAITPYMLDYTYAEYAGLTIDTLTSSESIDEVDPQIKITATSAAPVTGYFTIYSSSDCTGLIHTDDVYVDFTDESAKTITIDFPVEKLALITESKGQYTAGVKFTPIKAADVTSTTATTGITPITTRVKKGLVDAIEFKAVSDTEKTGSVVAVYTDEDGDEHQVGIYKNITITTQEQTFSLNINDWSSIPEKAGAWEIDLSFIDSVTLSNIPTIDDTGIWTTYSMAGTIPAETSVSMANPTVTVSGFSVQNIPYNHINLLVGYMDGEDFVEVGRHNDITPSTTAQDITIEVNDWLNITSSTQLVVKAELLMKTITMSFADSTPEDLYPTFETGFGEGNVITQPTDGSDVPTKITIHSNRSRWAQKGTFTFTDKRTGQFVMKATRTFGSELRDATLEATYTTTQWNALVVNDTQFEITYQEDTTTFKQGYLSVAGSLPSGVSPWFDSRLITSEDSKFETPRTFGVTLRNDSDENIPVRLWLKGAGGASCIIKDELTLSAQTVWNTVSDITVPDSFWTNFTNKSNVVLVVEDLR